jgi:hypothetical protein
MEKPPVYEADFRPPEEKSMVWLTVKIILALVFIVGLYLLVNFTASFGINLALGKVQSIFRDLWSLTTAWAVPVGVLFAGLLLGILGSNAAAVTRQQNAGRKTIDEDEEDWSWSNTTSMNEHVDGDIPSAGLGFNRVDIKQGMTTNIYSGDTYVRTGAFMTSSTGETYTEVGSGHWTDSHNKTIQREGNEFVNLDTGVRSSFGDPFKD